MQFLGTLAVKHGDQKIGLCSGDKKDYNGKGKGSSNSVAQKPFGGEGVAFTVITADQRLGALRYTVKHSGCHKSEIGDHTIGGNADITGNPKDQKIKGCGCYTG